MSNSESTRLPAPPRICDACLAAALALQGSACVVAYCDHSQSGAAFHGAGWIAWSPIERETFFDLVNESAVDLLSRPLAS